MEHSEAKRTWETVAQPFEQAYWEEAYERKAAASGIDSAKIRKGQKDISRRIWQNFKFPQKSFTGKTVLDIGPGPTGRCSWLHGRFIAIEPLADQFSQLPGGLERYKQVYAQPAEELIPELIGTVDAVLSLNALDHCYDPTAILVNVFEYMKPGGVAFLSFDADKPEYDPTHPISMTAGESRVMIEAAGLVVTRHTHGHCYPGEPWLDCWGGGTAHHWWCEKSEDVCG